MGKNLEFVKPFMVKFIYSEKAKNFCEISTLLLSYVVPVKSKVEISQNFVAFSEYMNFNPRLYYERVVEIILSHSVITYSLLFLHISPRFIFSPHSNFGVILEFSPQIDRQGALGGSLQVHDQLSDQCVLGRRLSEPRENFITRR